MNWKWAKPAAISLNLQNRLGFVVTLGRELAERNGNAKAAHLLNAVEDALLPSVLAREDTMCNSSLTRAERQWLQEKRPAHAKQWHVLSDMTIDHLFDTD